MQNDDKPDRIGTQTEGAETDAMYEGTDHLGKNNPRVAKEKVRGVQQRKENRGNDYTLCHAKRLENVQDNAAHLPFLHKASERIANQQIDEVAPITGLDASQKGQTNHDQTRDQQKAQITPGTWCDKARRLPT